MQWLRNLWARLKGWRTIIVGGLVAIVPAALEFAASIDLRDYGLTPTMALFASGMIQIAMRVVTTAPVGVSEDDDAS